VELRAPNLALQRTRSALASGSPRAEDEHARASLGGHSCGAAERGR
jgi:hypothetical protein